jgi:aryl-alcohol dehydrogenase-like predicted oxidoreductase
MSTARLGLGLAAIGRPAYITTGRADDLGDPERRSESALRARAHDLLDTAWELGVRHLDAARSYGSAEAFIGTWLARHPERRAELVIGSKWGYEYVGAWRMDAAAHERKSHDLAMFEAQWPQTLEALGTRPDLYLIHSVTPDSPALGDTGLLDALRRLAERGVRVGISTSGARQADVIFEALALADSPFRAVQATWNLLEQSAAPALAAAHAAGWTVVVKEAVANGRLSPAGDEPDVLAFAAVDAQPLDAFALGAALAQPWADLVLSGAVTPAQLRHNLAARPPAVDAHVLHALAEPAEQYWAERGRRAWT